MLRRSQVSGTKKVSGVSDGEQKSDDRAQRTEVEKLGGWEGEKVKS